MATHAQDPLTRAKQIAAQEDAWAKAKADSNYEGSIDAHFKDASARDLIKMHETSRNLAGQKLSGFESRALYSAWLQRFGEREPLDYTPRAAPSTSAAVKKALAHFRAADRLASA
jgi:hypothetical protein